LIPLAVFLNSIASKQANTATETSQTGKEIRKGPADSLMASEINWRQFSC
jgi:hypothetical protein